MNASTDNRIAAAHAAGRRSYYTGDVTHYEPGSAGYEAFWSGFHAEWRERLEVNCPIHGNATDKEQYSISVY